MACLRYDKAGDRALIIVREDLDIPGDVVREEAFETIDPAHHITALYSQDDELIGFLAYPASLVLNRDVMKRLGLDPPPLPS